MKLKTNRRVFASSLLAIAAGLVGGCGGGDDDPIASARDTALKFDAAAYTTVNVTVDGTAVTMRQYRRVYVAKAIKMAATQQALGSTNATTLTDPYAYQTLIVSVPEAAVGDQTKPIYMVVNNAGWMTSAVATTITEGRAFVSTNDTDAISAALKAGYVVVNVGTRSRGARAEDGRWAGKAPAPVVDTKAAIRYLRLNDSTMPGTTNNLGNADAGYEWEYNANLNDWLTLTGTGTAAKVASIDYAKFLTFVTKIRALKTVVAFDAVGVTGNPNISGESTLFGSDSFGSSNFSRWSWTNNSVRGDGSGVDDTGLAWDAYLASASNNLSTQLKLINPIAYLNTAADTAPYWYVRHGMIDRDTAFAMQALLYYAIRKDPSVKEVDYKIPYLVPHSGNYDV